MQKPIPTQRAPSAHPARTQRASIAHRAVNVALFISLIAVILSVAFGGQP